MNKNPNVIASHYLTTVQELEGVPRRKRCDRGTENTITGSLQQFFRWHDVDDFDGRGSFLEGKSWGISVSKPGGPNFVRDEADAYCG